MAEVGASTGNMKNRQIAERILKLVLTLVIIASLPACVQREGVRGDNFEGFPAIGQHRSGERTTKVITSDLITDVVRPQWTRAMGDMGGWPVMYRLKNRIHLSYPHVDAHRGKRLEATGGQIDWVSNDEGRSWHKPEVPMPVAKEVLVAKGTIYFYINKPNGPSQVCTSRDGKTFSEWKDVYKSPFWLWGAMYDPVSDMFWAPPHAIPKGPAQGTRQIHLIQSKDGIQWDYVSTVHSNQDESEAALRFEKDRTAVVLIRQKWGPRVCWVATAKPPYKEWNVITHPQNVGGEHFYEIGGQTFVATRAVLKGKSPETQAIAEVTGKTLYYSAIFKFTDDHQLVPWAVMESMGDCSYPRLVETPTEILCAYYSEHEDKTCKVFLCAYDKREFLEGPQ